METTSYVYSVMETRDWDGDPAYVRAVCQTLEGVLEEVGYAIDNRADDVEALKKEAERSLREWWPGPSSEKYVDRRDDEWVFSSENWESDHEVIVTRHKLVK